MCVEGLGFHSGVSLGEGIEAEGVQIWEEERESVEKELGDEDD